LHMVHMQNIIREIQNGHHSAVLSNQPKIEKVLVALVHNHIRFHENHSKTFHVILFTDKWMDGRYTGENITSLAKVVT